MVGFGEEGSAKGYIEVIRHIYEKTVPTIRLPASETSEFSITVGLLQGSMINRSVIFARVPMSTLHDTTWVRDMCRVRLL